MTPIPPDRALEAAKEIADFNSEYREPTISQLAAIIARAIAAAIRDTGAVEALEKTQEYALGEMVYWQSYYEELREANEFEDETEITESEKTAIEAANIESAAKRALAALRKLTGENNT